MRKDDIRTIGFAAIVCVACSLLLAATASALRQRQESNVENDRKLNVLKAFGVNIRHEDKTKLTADEINQYFEDHISEVVIDAKSGEVLEGVTSFDLTTDEVKSKQKLPLYIWKDGDDIERYAFPISGMGLWSTLYGYLALDKDLATIIGITFYKHGETPGLGGEVDAAWFQEQFIGKKVYEDGSLLEFEVVKGSVEGKYPGGSDHAVDGISGATMTGNGINQFLNADLARYEKYFSKVRDS